MIGRRRAGNPQEPNEERWLITYSDMISRKIVNGEKILWGTKLQEFLLNIEKVMYKKRS